MATPLALTSLSLSPPKVNAPMRVKPDKAAYGVGGKGFFDNKCKFWQNGQALYYDGEPNLDLHPLNKLAYDAMTAFLDKLDVLDERKAKKDGKAYVKREREEWREDGIYDDLPTPESVMGARIEGVNEQIR